MNAAPALSAITACLDEQEIIAAFIERTSQACEKETAGDYELIIVNDGSRDATADIVVALAKENPHIFLVNLSRSFGHQAALSAGLSMAKGHRIFMLDADLQDPPELLREMMRALDDGAEIAYGQRTAREGETWHKKAAAACFYRVFSHLADTKMPPQAGDFRLLSRRALKLIMAMPERSRFLRGMTSWIGLKQTPIPYRRAPRSGGKTKYPFRKAFRFAMDALTGFSVVPLRIASYIGAAFGLLGFVLLIYVLRAWIMDETVAGWTSMMVVVLLIGGVQLLCLGVFGEYLGRMYLEIKGRPLFIVESTYPPSRHPCEDKDPVES
jgi:dolichol-phosphate mannosyltransferase